MMSSELDWIIWIGSSQSTHLAEDGQRLLIMLPQLLGRALAVVGDFGRGAEILFAIGLHFHIINMQTPAATPSLTTPNLSRSCLLTLLVLGHTFLPRLSSIL